MSGLMTCRPLFRGGYQILENGRAIGALHSKAAAELFCRAINEREGYANKNAEIEAAWNAHDRRAA
jgi:hypothetical protein